MILCFAEFTLLIFGVVTIIMTLVNGRLPVSADRELRGWQPFVLGLLLILPFPVTLLFNVINNAHMVRDQDDILIELLLLAPFIVAAILVGVLGTKKRKKPKLVKRRTRPDLDDEDDDRPRRRRRDRYDDDDDDDDDRPRRRRRDDDDY